MKVRAFVDGPRVRGHRIRAGKSRASLLIGAAVLLAEYPFDTAAAQTQTTLPPVNVDAPAQRSKPARASGTSEKRTQVVARQRNRAAAAPAAPTLSERAAADAAVQQAAKLGYRAMPSASTLRSGASPLDTSQAVNVVPAQVLKDQLPRNIDDALVNISGITQTNTLAGTQDAVIRRGFGDNRDGSIMRNGMPLVQGRSLNAAVDSVEVLKGPASLLYGIMDPGGIVNTISKRPELYQHGSVTLLGSTYASNRNGADVEIRRQEIVWFPRIHRDHGAFGQLVTSIIDIDTCRTPADMEDQMTFAMRVDVEGAVQLIDRRPAEAAVEDGERPAHAFPPSSSCLF